MTTTTNSYNQALLAFSLKEETKAENHRHKMFDVARTSTDPLIDIKIKECNVRYKKNARARYLRFQRERKWDH